LREDEVLPALDAWLARIFDVEHLDETCAMLAAASSADDTDRAALEGARRKLLDCDKRLARYRAALEGGADPKEVAGWIAQVQRERLRAEQALALAQRDSLTPEDVRAVLAELPDMREVLAEADPALKAKVYADLGIRLTYKPKERTVLVEATPTRVPQCVSEGRSHPNAHRRFCGAIYSSGVRCRWSWMRAA
jgi:hypothetical protein